MLRGFAAMLVLVLLLTDQRRHDGLSPGKSDGPQHTHTALHSADWVEQALWQLNGHRAEVLFNLGRQDSMSGGLTSPQPSLKSMLVVTEVMS